MGQRTASSKGGGGEGNQTGQKIVKVSDAILQQPVEVRLSPVERDRERDSFKDQMFESLPILTVIFLRGAEAVFPDNSVKKDNHYNYPLSWIRACTPIGQVNQLLQNSAFWSAPKRSR